MTDTVSQTLRAGAGLLTLILPALAAPPQGLILTGAGVLLVVASVLGRFSRWAGTLAAVVPVVQCAIWPPGTALLAAEGLLILGYLLLLDGLTGLRGQLRFGAAGLIGAGVVLAALEVPAATSAWLVLAGLGAAVAAYVIAVPIRHTGDSRRG
jgi:hypothetical protein